MTRTLGPFDKRAQRKRCTRCIKRHLKCHGVVPCRNCAASQSACHPSHTTQAAIIIPDNVRRHTSSPSWTLAVQTVPRIPYRVSSDHSTLYLMQLYNDSLPLSFFTGSPTTSFSDLHQILQSAPALHNAAIAISVLARRTPMSVACPSNPKAATEALRFHSQAVTALRGDLALFHNTDVSSGNAHLWTTLLLSIFELMYDRSGDGTGFVTHLLYGTSTLLQHLGPVRCLTTGPTGGRRFFITLRIFEISRALIFTSGTFLSRPDWQAMMRQLWTGDGAEDWHPIELLYDLMIQAVDLAVRCAHVPQPPTQQNPWPLPTIKHHILIRRSRSRPIVESTYTSTENLAALSDFATEGLSLQAALSTWHQNYILTGPLSSSLPTDVRTTLCQIYHPATAIYLDGIFSYHPSHYNDLHISAPTLSFAEIHSHLVTILSHVSQALYRHTTLAGILFLFPLRVAGARARTRQESMMIREMLHEIARKGFVVAESFVQDLDEVWSTKQIAE